MSHKAQGSDYPVCSSGSGSTGMTHKAKRFPTVCSSSSGSTGMTHKAKRFPTVCSSSSGSTGMTHKAKRFPTVCSSGSGSTGMVQPRELRHVIRPKRGLTLKSSWQQRTNQKDYPQSCCLVQAVQAESSQ